jgi:hypothetical protein
MSGNPNVVNIVELSNNVTSVTNTGSDLGTLTTNVRNLQQMVNFTDKKILADIVGKFATPQVNFQDNVTFKKNIIIDGTITLKGTQISSSQPLGANSGNVLLSNGTNTYYTNSFYFPNGSLIQQNASLVPAESINLGSSTNLYSTVYSTRYGISNGTGVSFITANNQGNLLLDGKSVNLSGSGTTDSTGLLNVTFSSAFTSVPNVVATIKGANFGLIKIGNTTLTGFTVNTVSPTLVPTSYAFNWTAAP